MSGCAAAVAGGLWKSLTLAVAWALRLQSRARGRKATASVTPKRLPLAVALEREARAAGVEAAVDLEAEPPYSTRRLQPLPSVSDVIAKDALSEGGARRGALTRGARSRGCRDDAVATLAAVVADADALPLS